jgi:hypothetical protein
MEKGAIWNALLEAIFPNPDLLLSFFNLSRLIFYFNIQTAFLLNYFWLGITWNGKMESFIFITKQCNNAL